MVLVAVFANYGVMATVAHSHEHQGFHQAHVEWDGDHGHHQDVSGNDHEEIDPDLPGPYHSETGFHSHSAPQFSPADLAGIVAVPLIAPDNYSPHPDSVVPTHTERPPFKPPRLIL